MLAPGAYLSLHHQIVILFIDGNWGFCSGCSKLLNFQQPFDQRTNQCQLGPNVSLNLQMGEEASPSPPPHWFPLATEQLRLRALTDIYLLHPNHGFVFNILLMLEHCPWLVA